MDNKYKNYIKGKLDGNINPVTKQIHYAKNLFPIKISRLDLDQIKHITTQLLVESRITATERELIEIEKKYIEEISKILKNYEVSKNV